MELFEIHLYVRLLPPIIFIVKILRCFAFTENDAKISSILEQYAKVNPIHAESLRKKAQFQEKKRAIFTDRDEFMILINAVDSVLAEIETELEKNGMSLCNMQ